MPAHTSRSWTSRNHGVGTTVTLTTPVAHTNSRHPRDDDHNVEFVFEDVTAAQVGGTDLRPGGDEVLVPMETYYIARVDPPRPDGRTWIYLKPGKGPTAPPTPPPTQFDKPGTSGSGTGPPGTGPVGLTESDTSPDAASAATDGLEPNQPADTTTQDGGERQDDGGAGESGPSVVVLQALVPPLSTLASSGIDATAARLLVGRGESAGQLAASWAAFRTEWEEVIRLGWR